MAMGGYVKRRAERPVETFDFPKERLLTSQQALVALAEGRIHNHVWNKLFRATLWKDVRFPPDRVYDDVFTIYRIFPNAKGILAVPGPQVLHRIRPESISQTCSAKHIVDWMEAYAELEQFVKDHIPGLFQDSQLRCVQSRMLGVIAPWCTLSWKGQREAALVRRRILRMKTVGLENKGFRGQMARVLIRFCPCLIPPFYPIYRFVTRLGPRPVPH